MKTARTLTVSSLFALGFVLMSQVVFAQNDPGAKIRGDAWYGGRAQMFQRHAQDRSQMLFYYSQSKQPLPKPEVKELVKGIEKDVTEAENALAKLKADHAKEPDVVKQIALIEKHHARAKEVCSMAAEQCEKEHGDHVMVCDCCADMWHELDAAQAETQKLFKMLKIDKLPTPKKATDKKVAAEKKPEAKKADK